MNGFLPESQKKPKYLWISNRKNSSEEIMPYLLNMQITSYLYIFWIYWNPFSLAQTTNESSLHCESSRNPVSAIRMTDSGVLYGFMA